MAVLIAMTYASSFLNYAEQSLVFRIEKYECMRTTSTVKSLSTHWDISLTYTTITSRPEKKAFPKLKMIKNHTRGTRFVDREREREREDSKLMLYELLWM